MRLTVEIEPTLTRLKDSRLLTMTSPVPFVHLLLRSEPIAHSKPNHLPPRALKKFPATFAAFTPSALKHVVAPRKNMSWLAYGST